MQYPGGVGNARDALLRQIRVIRFRPDDWQVMIYRNGQIDIQRAKDIDDAVKTVKRCDGIPNRSRPVEYNY